MFLRCPSSFIVPCNAMADPPESAGTAAPSSSENAAADPATDAAVLYLDHAGHPAPLGLCYHATASRYLSSSIDDRSPPTTAEEIDSAYCPQCLAFHDAATASGTELRGRCPRGGCRSCPLCEAVCGVAVVPEDNGGGGKMVCVYRCGYCQWTSRSCSVSAPVSAGEDGSVSKEEATSAAEALDRSLSDRTRERSAAADDVFSKLVEGWKERAQDEERRRRHPETASATKTKRGGVSAAASDGWGIDSLEEVIAEKKKDRLDVTQVVEGFALTRLGPNDLAASDEPPSPNSAGAPRPTPVQASSQLGLSPAPVPASCAELLPLPVPLRARKSRRCRRELAEGRTGILVKPKVNPLEGDSSLRSGHGQWWKKDSSAVHSVPRVSVVRLGSTDPVGPGKPGRHHALLLSVRNPTLNAVRLSVGPPSDAPGQLDGDELDGVLVDGIDGRRVDARRIDDGGEGGKPTESVELEPVQDAFLEMGRGRGGSPEEVEGWDAAAALSGEVADVPSLRLVAAREDTAWVEFIAGERGEASDSGAEAGVGSGASHVAAALSLRIEVGEGSWESSLVKPRSSEREGEVDTVNVDLLVLWRG